MPIQYKGLEGFIHESGIHIEQSNLLPKLWLLENALNAGVKVKIETNGRKLKDISGVKVNRGVTTGYNPAFIIDEATKLQLISADKKCMKIIKPLIQGRNIKKWCYSSTGEYLIFTKQGININNYKEIESYLRKFYEELKPRNNNEQKGRKPGLYKWFEIQDNTAYYPEFEKEKIVWGLTADKWAFAYDSQGQYLPSNGYILISEQVPVKYIIALLNSKLMKFYFGFIGIMTAGGAYTLKHETILEFPIPETADYKSFIKVVDQILTTKQKDPTADTTELENQIDIMVYKLYDLTYEEVKIIDPEFEMTEKEYDTFALPEEN